MCSRDAKHVEHEMFDNTGNNWSHRNSNRRFKEKFEAILGKQKTFNRFTATSALRGTSHIKPKGLKYETGSLRVGDRY